MLLILTVVATAEDEIGKEWTAEGKKTVVSLAPECIDDESGEQNVFLWLLRLQMDESSVKTVAWGTAQERVVLQRCTPGQLMSSEYCRWWLLITRHVVERRGQKYCYLCLVLDEDLVDGLVRIESGHLEYEMGMWPSTGAILD